MASKTGFSVSSGAQLNAAPQGIDVGVANAPAYRISSGCQWWDGHRRRLLPQWRVTGVQSERRRMAARDGLLAIMFLAVPATANAQPVSGLYIGAGAGVNLLQDISADGGILGVARVQSQAGPAAVLSLGWGFGNGLRAEVEGSFRSNKFIDTIDEGTFDSAAGSERKFGAMVNVLYDFNGIVPWLTPYVGVGVGYQAAFQQNVSSSNTAIGSVNLANSTRGSFAYQAIVGAAFPLPAIAPGLAATLEYRFMGLAGGRSYNAAINVAGAPPTGAVIIRNDYNHAFLVGLRYNFGVTSVVTAAPAAAPAPAVTPARSYLVFFDWDKATLTDRARQIIAEASANSTKVQYTRIEVNGYTDTSGTPQYNQGLSVRRAQAVAAELVKDGVPQAAISIQGFGETHLLVPTGPGVRELQNRRVEIIVR
jgi:outer membrane protein OmpA-like peptidoglycan-associated protein/outer membrane protein W